MSVAPFLQPTSYTFRCSDFTSFLRYASASSCVILAYKAWIPRIIGYCFIDHNLLTCSLWHLSTDVIDPQINSPRPEILVRMCQVALDAYGWQLIWFKKFLMERFKIESLASTIVGRNAWDQNVNLEMVAKESGLLPYLERREGLIGPRVQAIIGAVFLDAQGTLEEVKHVLRALKIIDQDGLYVDPGEKDGSRSDGSRSDGSRSDGSRSDCSKSDWEYVNKTD